MLNELRYVFIGRIRFFGRRDILGLLESRNGIYTLLNDVASSPGVSQYQLRSL